MLNKKSYKKVVITVLALVMVLGTVALAAEGIYEKQLTATYGRIKFNYEGSDVTSQIEEKYGAPAFVVVDKAYAPVRSIADLVGVNIDYDTTTHTVKITDPKVEEHKKQMDEKNKEIADLKAKIEKLEKSEKEEVKKPDPVKNDLKTLQTSLNRDYGYYKEVDFDIVLSDKNSRMNVEITTSFMNAKNEYNWGRMTSVERRYIVENVVNQVRNSFPNENISGFIFDSYNKRSLYSFSQNVNGTLSTSDGGYIGTNDGYYNNGYASVNSYVNSTFASYGIAGASLYDYSYDQLNRTFKIDFAETYRSTWVNLTAAQKESLLYNVTRQLETNYGYYNNGYYNDDYYYNNGYYNDDYYYNNGYYNDDYYYNNGYYNYNYTSIAVVIGGSTHGTYTKYRNESSGTYR